MKTFLFALMAMMYAVVASASTYLVYDFKASFTRIDPSYMEISYKLDEFDAKFKKGDSDVVTALFDTFGSTKDSLKGYLVVPECEEEGFLYVQRSGDKLNKSLWKLNAKLVSAMFNKGVSARFIDMVPNADLLESKPTSMKKLKSAWAMMEFVVPFDGAEAKVFPKQSEQPAFYGFLGFQSTDGTAEGCGFGSVKVIPPKRGSKTVFDFCGEERVVGEDASALAVLNNISGCMGGVFNYTVICDELPMFDICTLFSVTKTGDEEAPICGTWSIKFNEKMSGPVLEGENSIEAAIKGKIKNGGLRGLWNVPADPYASPSRGFSLY